MAKGVGLLPLTKATHVLVVTTGAFTSEARRYAREINASSAVTLFLLDAQAVATVRETPSALGRVLRTQAEHIMDQKMQHVVWSGLEKQAPAPISSSESEPTEST